MDEEQLNQKCNGHGSPDSSKVSDASDRPLGDNGPKFYVWIQTLRHDDPDILFCNDVRLDKEATDNAMELMVQFSLVTSGGQRTYAAHGTYLYLKASRFVLQCTSGELEESGWRCFVSCLGVLPEKITESWAEHVVLHMSRCAGSIVRTIDPTAEKNAHTALTRAKYWRPIVRSSVGKAIAILMLTFIQTIWMRLLSYARS